MDVQKITEAEAKLYIASGLMDLITLIILSLKAQDLLNYLIQNI